MSLRHSYTFFAPIYDAMIAAASRPWRNRSLERLRAAADTDVLITGIGTGLDIEHLPHGPRYTGIDLTPAMLKKAQLRAEQSHHEIELHEGDVMDLPFEDACFDHVVMHLILAVVPEPHRALQEACRVIRPGGDILILDKFLRPGQLAPLRRLINPVISRLATRTNVIFEELMQECPELECVDDQPVMPGGWFRYITVRKNG
jgi:phosphatidylethanolamine/phosphatidyl-N-methylethanolamine N-methyltransferase